MPKVREGGVVGKMWLQQNTPVSLQLSVLSYAFFITQRDITLVPLGTLTLKREFLVCDFLLSLYE